MEAKEALALAAAYFERLGDEGNAALAYDAYVEADGSWQALLKAAKAYLRLYAMTKKEAFVRKAHAWLEKALLMRDEPEVYYYLGIASLLLGREDEVGSLWERAKDYAQGRIIEGIEAAIEARRKKLAKEGIEKLKDPFLIKLYTFLRGEVGGPLAERLKDLYEKIVVENIFQLKDGWSKVAALIYFALREFNEKERKAFKAAIENGVVRLDRLPPYTRHLVERFTNRERQISLPFFLKKDLEELNRLGEELGRLDKARNPHRAYQSIMEKIRKGIKAFKKKASLILSREQIKDILKLYISTLPVDEEEKFSLMDLL